MMSIPPWMHGVAFTIEQGRQAGLSYAHMRRAAFDRPFHGVRVIGTAGRTDGGLVDRCADLRIALPAAAVFTHATAARLWGLPLPGHLSDELHVMVPRGTPVRRPGVIGWTRADDLVNATLVHGLPVMSPADTWVSIATMTAERGGRITREWLVAIADFIVSGRRTRWGREPALATVGELIEAVGRHGSRRGTASLAWALARVRSPVDSPPETLVRLGLVAARLPEPQVQPTIPTAAGDRHPDLAYVAERVLIEYLGEVHRLDPRTWRADLTRVQLFEDAGYRVILAGADQLSASGLAELGACVRRALRAARPA
ncbi:hypothetical protein ABZ477_08970 [Microbacterium sp. NPDC019599]|uniref:hypothetical protein n=1 Tax=Microbacterium sp. NPDC019599 TaxID=3154690 RepID=UPI0033E94C21